MHGHMNVKTMGTPSCDIILPYVLRKHCSLWFNIYYDLMYGMEYVKFVLICLRLRLVSRKLDAVIQ
jgi:hypothetical protein